MKNTIHTSHVSVPGHSAPPAVSAAAPATRPLQAAHADRSCSRSKQDRRRGASASHRLVARRHLYSLAAVATLVAAGLQGSPVAAADADRPLPVVTSFSILQDLVRQVGGDRVSVETLVAPGGDTHVFQPGPSQVRLLSAARLVVVNGLGFEGWMPRLIRSSGYRGPVVEAAQGVTALQASDDHHHHHGDEGADEAHAHKGHGHADHHQVAARGHHDRHHDGVHDHDKGERQAHGKAGHDDAQAADVDAGKDHAHDEHAAGQDGQGETAGHHHAHYHDGTDPHAWQDVENVRRYVANIAQALCTAAPDECAGFRQRAAAYDQQLKALDEEIHAAIDAVPLERRRVMVSHAAFGYFANAYHVQFMAPVGVSTEAEPSAAVVGRLIREAREKEVKAFFFENNSDPRLLQRMASELKDIRIGELYADTLSKAGGEAPDYLSMMRFNTRAITHALNGR